MPVCASYCCKQRFFQHGPPCKAPTRPHLPRRHAAACSGGPESSAGPLVLRPRSAWATALGLSVMEGLSCYSLLLPNVPSRPTPEGASFRPSLGAAPSGGPQPARQGCRCSAVPEGVTAPSPAAANRARSGATGPLRAPQEMRGPAALPPPPAPSRTRALRAREPAAGGDWLPGAPRGPPGRGRPPSAIHGAARLHAPRLIHKKKKKLHS